MMSVADYPLIIDYCFCNQTVTLYSYANGTVTRTVHSNAYHERTEKQVVDERGARVENEYLIIIPGNVSVSVGDRVYLGTGDAVGNDAAAFWRGFIPAKNDNVVVVRKVSYRHWQGQVTHVEIRG